MEVLFPPSSSVSSSNSSGGLSAQKVQFSSRCCGNAMSTELGDDRTGSNSGRASESHVAHQVPEGIEDCHPAILARAESYRALRLAFFGSRNGSRRQGRRCVKIDCTVAAGQQPEDCHVAMGLLRESVLGATMGSPRKRRCVRFDFDESCGRKDTSPSTEKAPAMETRRKELVGNRHGTPPRSPTSPKNFQAGYRETRKVRSEKLPQSSSVQVQRIMASLQLAPRRSQSCASSGLPALSPLGKQGDSNRDAWVSNAGLLERTEEDDEDRERLQDQEQELVKSTAREQPEEAAGKPRVRMARRAASEKLPQGDLRQLGRGRSYAGCATHGRSDDESRAGATVGSQGVQSGHNSPVFLSPRAQSHREGQRVVSPRSSRVSPRQLIANRGTQRRGPRTVGSNRLGARMPLDEATLQYYAGEK